MADDDRSADELPDDPFEIDLSQLEGFTGPRADEIRRLAREYASAGLDFSALLHQRSFLELRSAIGAMDEERVRTVLLRAVVTSVHRHMDDEYRFVSWMEDQSG